jgi:hypothetical protein
MKPGSKLGYSFSGCLNVVALLLQDLPFQYSQPRFIIIQVDNFVLFLSSHLYRTP